jgi:hypothetical protein
MGTQESGLEWEYGHSMIFLFNIYIKCLIILVILGDLFYC